MAKLGNIPKSYSGSLYDLKNISLSHTDPKPHEPNRRRPDQGFKDPSNDNRKIYNSHCVPPVWSPNLKSH